MKKTGVTNLKARLSQFLAVVKAGDEVLVTERGVPIARLVPLPVREESEAGWEVLERAGLIRRPVRRLDEGFWALPRPADPNGSVRADLIAEREGGW